MAGLTWVLRGLISVLLFGGATNVHLNAEGDAATPTCVMRTLVVSAYPAETDAVLGKTVLAPTPIVHGKSHVFYAGAIGGKSVLVAMSGIGLVNAKATAEDALGLTCATNGTFIAAVLFSGVAGGGGKTLIGDVAVPKRWTLDGTTFHSVDPDMLKAAEPLAAEGGPKFETSNTTGDPLCTKFQLASQALVGLGRAPKVVLGGDGHSADSLGGKPSVCIPGAGDTYGCKPCTAPDYDGPGATTITAAAGWATQSAAAALGGTSKTNFDADDEETAAVQAVADAKKVPFLAFRGISDGAGDPLNLPGFPFQFFVYKTLAANNSAIALAAFMDAWDGPTGVPTNPETTTEPTAPAANGSSLEPALTVPSGRSVESLAPVVPGGPVSTPGAIASPVTNTSAHHKARQWDRQDFALIVLAMLLILCAAMATQQRKPETFR